MEINDLFSKFTPHLQDCEINLIKESVKEDGSLVHLGQYEVLCSEGEAGDCLWIISDGKFEISSGDQFITERGPGFVIGEQAILIDDGRRSATVKSTMASKVYRVPKSALVKSPELRAAWFRLIALGLAEKLSEATERRGELSIDLDKLENLIRKFVCEYSLGKVRAFIEGGANESVAIKALIWFSDLAGYSKYVQQLDPNEAAQVVRALLKIQADIIHGQGANIDKFMGDAVMAFWVVEAEEDLTAVAEKAVIAAIETARQIEAEAERLGFDIGLRIGLHHGKVISGNFGSDNRIAHTLIGPDVNLAARYEQAKLTVAGTDLFPVRISPELYSALSPKLKDRFTPAEKCKVKHDLEIPVHHGPKEKD